MPVKISQLPVSTNPPNTTDLLPIVQGGITKQTTLGALFTQLLGFLPSGSGAVARTVQGRLRDEVHIYDFLTAAEQADVQASTELNDLSTAVSRAMTQATGSRLVIPYGTYITANFTVPNNIRLVGDGPRTTKIKMKASTNSNLVAATAGTNVMIEGLTLDGNNTNNTSGRCISFTTDASADGPALVMRDVVITNSPLGSGDNSGAFFSGLAWMIFDNVRYVNNKGTLWLSTNDSEFHRLYVGNCGVVANVPSVIIGGGDNAFFRAYFGGNGANTSTAAAQVQFLGASYNVLVGCTNDSANGNGYQFNDSGGVFSQYNQIIGGQTTNPSQSLTNTSYHILFSDTSKFNIVKGHILHNTKTAKGKYGIAENVNANANLIQGCQFGTFGTSALATVGSGTTPTRVLDCVGITPQGTVNPGAIAASPATITNNQNVRIVVYIYGGTVSAIVKDTIALSVTTNASVWLEPGEAVTITYSVAPTVTLDRK